MAELIKQGSLKAFHILYDKYAPALLGAILRITGEQTIAENILQQTFIELWNNKQTYEPSKGKIFTWMFKTARKIAVENLRAQNLMQELSCINNLVYSKEVEEYITQKNKTANIEDETKKALHLIYFKACTIDEAAHKLNITINDLRSKLILAIEQLNSVVA